MLDNITCEYKLINDEKEEDKKFDLSKDSTHAFLIMKREFEKIKQMYFNDYEIHEISDIPKFVARNPKTKTYYQMEIILAIDIQKIENKSWTKYFNKYKKIYTKRTYFKFSIKELSRSIALSTTRPIRMVNKEIFSIISDNTDTLYERIKSLFENRNEVIKIEKEIRQLKLKQKQLLNKSIIDSITKEKISYITYPQYWCIKENTPIGILTNVNELI
jgi:hypothetical protein